MDVEARSSSPEPERAHAIRRPSSSSFSCSPQPCHEGPLIGHVSQPLNDTANTRTLHQHPQPAEPLPLHPFYLNFPTLNIDGSVDDLTAHQSRRYTTPPAALSTLGAKASMTSRDDARESESSHSDSQYEIISYDELSEVSSDDHDTASITSNDGGLNTPEYIGSDDEQEQEQTVPLDRVLVASSTLQESGHDDLTPPSTAASFVTFPSPPLAESLRTQQIKAENDLIDSYMSEDLETPRQSTIPAAMPVPRGLPSVKSPSLQDDTKHILFFSIRDHSKGISQQDMDLICSRVATCMHTAKPGHETIHKVLRLPLTPSGILPPSATVICGQDTISATIQHCVGAERRPFGSYGLRILDCDGDHSSIYTVGGNAKIDLLKPDIAIFYIDGVPDESGEVAIAYHAVQSLKVPILMIHEPTLGASGLPSAFKGKRNQQLTIEAGEFLELNCASLKTMIQRLVGDGTPARSRKGSLSKKSPWLAWLKSALGALMLFLYVSMAWPALIWNRAVDIPARREALIASLEQATQSVNVTQEFNIEHLVPSLPAVCYSGRVSSPAAECEQTVRLQGGIYPNIVLSLPGPNYPTAYSTIAYKKDGRSVDFNQTKLIDGIYLLTIDANEAYDTVYVNMMTKDPQMNITETHNFGRQRFRAFEKNTTDVSKVDGTDIAAIRAAKMLSGKLATEFGAGVSATRNVTNQIAVYVARELQVVGDTAASMLGKAIKAGNHTSTLSKDVMLIQKDLVKYTKGLTESVKSQFDSVKSNSKAAIRSRLLLSRERLMDLKKAVKDKKESRRKAAVTNISKDVNTDDKAPTEKKIPPPLVVMKRMQAQRNVQKAEQELKFLKDQVHKQSDDCKKAQIRKQQRLIKKKEKTLQNLRDEMDRLERKELSRVKSPGDEL